MSARFNAVRGHRTLWFAAAEYTGPDNYTNAQGVSWTYNNLAVNQSDAEAMCNRQCGHLASYISAQEQYDVEQFYISNVRERACSSCTVTLMGADVVALFALASAESPDIVASRPH